MEKGIGFFMLFVYGSFFLVSLVIVIYLIAKRLKNDGKEGFEERDN
ncbi:hypothetical protein [Wenyingzhuangia sp. 2_MG-2023]|nr:hypothetical protein [Wenyingzhuangia sp. 2_MG-2023]MDO6737319.1 hypothetical protein [Wenyingzhuangia sp. 2_MG-2023]MDO6803079.1 hypothetical protein [Wenyingzhuangia sp. 1_MG-2023]